MACAGLAVGLMLACPAESGAKQGRPDAGEWRASVRSRFCSGSREDALAAIESDLREIAAMPGTPIPPDARWVLVGPPAGTELFLSFQLRDHAKSPRETTGWLLGDDGNEIRLLDVTGCERRLPKAGTTVLDRTLADEIGTSNPDLEMPPALLPAAWALERGDRKTAAALALPLYCEAGDPEEVKERAREAIASGLQARLNCEFGRRRDLRAAERIARHLASPVFEGNEFQKDAAELAEQLASGIGLPDGELPRVREWTSRRDAMSHADQLRYLFSVLFAKPPDGATLSGETPYEDRYLDPLAILRNSFKPEASDVEILIPFLDDLRFLPDQLYNNSFGTDRSCHPRRLGRVSTTASSLISRAQGFRTDVHAYVSLDAAGRAELKEKILAWNRENGSRSKEDLIYEKVLSEGSDVMKFQWAGELRYLGDSRAGPLLIELAQRSPEVRERGMTSLYLLDSPEVVPLVRDWIEDEKLKWNALSAAEKREASSKTTPALLWHALILLRQGDRSRYEGLDSIRSILEADTGGWSYNPAWGDVWDLGTPESRSLLLGVLDKPTVFDNLGTINDMLACNLFATGERRFIDIVAERISRKNIVERGYASMAADRADHVRECDRIGEWLADWSEGSPDAVTWDWDDPDEVRDGKIARLKEWFEAQHALVREGKPASIHGCSRVRLLPPLPPVTP